MRNWTKKMAAVIGLAAAMSILVCGCRKTEEDHSKKQTENQTAEQPKSQTEEQAEDGGEDPKESSEREDMTGDISEIQQNSLILNRYYKEELEDGILLIGSPAEGSQAEKDLVTVLFDEETIYSHLTIRDGGEHTEETETTLEELAVGMEITVYGQQEEDGFRASKIQVIEVIL